MNEVRRFEALVIPTEALERGGIEVLRAAIIGDELHVTLRRTFEQPHHWGELLSEVVERIARSYAEDGSMKEKDVLVRIRSSFASDGPVAAAGRKAKKPVQKTGKRSSKRSSKKSSKKSTKKKSARTGKGRGKKR